MKRLSLRRKIEGLCLVILIFAAFAGFSIIFHDEDPFGGYIGISGPADTAKQAADNSDPVRLKRHLSAMLFLICACFLACLFFVTGNVLIPLEEINRSLKKMAEGNLNEKIDFNRDDELGRTGDLINEFSINFQETLLFFWNHACSTEKRLDEISVMIEPGNPDLDPSELEGKIETLQSDMVHLQLMIQEYTFYGVKVENEKLMDNVTPDETNETVTG